MCHQSRRSVAFHTGFSRVFHPCIMVPRFPLPRFPPLHYGAVFSTPAFSTPCIFDALAFSTPAFSVAPMRNALTRRYITMGWHTFTQNVPFRGGSGPHLTHDSFYPYESAPTRHLNWFSRFCTAHPCVPHSDRHTDTLTTLRATSVAYVQAMRPNNTDRERVIWKVL